MYECRICKYVYDDESLLTMKCTLSIGCEFSARSLSSIATAYRPAGYDKGTVEQMAVCAPPEILKLVNRDSARYIQRWNSAIQRVRSLAYPFSRENRLLTLDRALRISREECRIHASTRSNTPRLRR